MKRFLFWLVVSCCIVGFTASDNPDFFTRVVHNFMVLRQARMQEKVWLHTDRPSYHAGDTIRFRAFLVEESFFFHIRVTDRFIDAALVFYVQGNFFFRCNAFIYENDLPVLGVRQGRAVALDGGHF